jgi:membrane protein
VAFDRDRCTLLAAGIAYYALFSFIPLTTLMLALVGFLVRDPASRLDALDWLLRAMPLQAAEGQNLVLDSLRAISAQTAALSITGLLGLIWTASGMLGAIRSSLNIVWKATPARGFLGDRVRDVCAVIAVASFLVLSMASTMLVNLSPSASAPGQAAGTTTATWIWTLVRLLVPVVVTFIGCALTYRYVPNVKHGFRDVWPGALLATTLFELTKHAFVVFADLSTRYHALYGVLGGVMLFMLSTYIAGVLLLIGAEFTHEYERFRIAPAGDQPSPGSQR